MEWIFCVNAHDLMLVFCSFDWKACLALIFFFPFLIAKKNDANSILSFFISLLRTTSIILWLISFCHNTSDSVFRTIDSMYDQKNRMENNYIYLFLFFFLYVLFFLS